jgi:hypothetical protein
VELVPIVVVSSVAVVVSSVDVVTVEGPSHEDSTNYQKIGSKMSRQNVYYQRHFSFSYV